MIQRLFLGISFFLADPNIKQASSKNQRGAQHTSCKSLFSFHFLQLQDVDLTTFLGAACLVASPTTRAEKLPEGLEEQVESTIIDPIARLRESSFKFFSSQKVNQKPNWLQRRWYPGALARIIPSTHPLQKPVFPAMASLEVWLHMLNYHFPSLVLYVHIYDVKKWYLKDGMGQVTMRIRSLSVSRSTFAQRTARGGLTSIWRN